MKGSLQQELDCFYQDINRSDAPFRVVGKSTFSEARKKLKISAFRAINQLVIDHARQAQSPKQWQGYHVMNDLVVDATMAASWSSEHHGT